MSWDEFAAAWSDAFDGYDLRHAPATKKRFIHAVYRLSGAVPVKPTITMLLSVACSASVPLFAWRGGQWPAVGALMVAFGLLAEAMTSVSAVRSGRVTRLESFYLTLVERFAEVCWLVAFLVLGAHPVAVICCAALVWAHEYLRVRAGGAAMRRAGAATIGDRAPRVWLVLVGLVLCATVASIGRDLAAGVATMVVVCWAALALVGLAQLFTIIRKALA